MAGRPKQSLDPRKSRTRSAAGSKPLTGLVAVVAGAKLAARYKPLRQIKRRVGRVATKHQLMSVIAKAVRVDHDRA
jgi:hypothetical protein